MITATLLRNSISNNNNNTKILSKNEIVIPFINEINECTTLINEVNKLKHVFASSFMYLTLINVYIFRLHRMQVWISLKKVKITANLSSYKVYVAIQLVIC